MATKRIKVSSGDKKKIAVKADESPELVAIFNPWQKAREAAGKAKDAAVQTEARLESRFSRWAIVFVSVLILIALAGGGFMLYRNLNKPASPLSPSLQAQLPFSPYIIPKDNSSYFTYGYRYSSAEGQAKILSFTIATPNNATIVLSEYPEPSQFSQDPNYEKQFLSSVAQQYASLNTANGTLYLGRTINTNNKQIGLLIQHGVLVLMSPSTDMNNHDWLELVNNLVRL